MKIKPVRPPAAVGAEYLKALKQLARSVRKDLDAELVPALKRLAPEYVSDSWSDDLMNIIARIKMKYTSSLEKIASWELARRFVRGVDEQNARKFRSFGINVHPEGIDDYLTGAINQNVSLIQSIPSQYLERVETMVMTNTLAGNRPSVIEKQLVKEFGITENRAKLIARDQTAKLSGDLSEKRQKAAGFEYFQWVDSDDERVRTRHRRIADAVTKYGSGVYRWDKLPLSDQGVPIKPGQDYQCRCIARPVSEEEVQENIRKGRTSRGR